MNTKKFLSHRLLGFTQGESSLEALKLAMNSHAPYLEVDTRVSKDGVIYINHNATIESKYASLTIAKQKSNKIDSFIKKHNLSTVKLELFLAEYTKRKNTKQILMLDIKDYGYEELHLQLVSKYKLQKAIAWVSWIPQTLLKIDTLSPHSTKFLSYVPVNDFFNTFTSNISVVKVPFTPIVLIGDKYYNKSLQGLTHGYQHALLSHNLNKELIILLSKNSSGVCVSKKFLTKKQLEFNKSNNIRTAVFSAENIEEYNKLSHFGADIIFSDFIPKEILS